MGTIALPLGGLFSETSGCSPEADGLVDRAKKGEQAAFFNLFQTHARRIYSLSLRLTADTSAAESLTRDIFLDAFKSIDSVTNDEAFSAFLCRRAATTMMARSTPPLGS